MPFQRIDKLDAARVQMEAAATAFLAGDFISAITLAAVAEEVIARFLPASKRSSQDELIARFAKEGIPAKEARDLYLNGSRNALKHHSDNDAPYMEFDPEVDAKVWITRALHNWAKLGNEFPPAVRQFIDKYEPRKGA